MAVLAQSVRILIAVSVIAACRSLETESSKLSQCLTDPLKGLMYRYTVRAEGVSGLEKGCYIVYGNGTDESSGQISHRKFFIVTAGFEIMVIKNRNSTVTVNRRPIKFNQSFFPDKCFDKDEDVSSEPSSTEAATTSVQFDSRLFCSVGRDTTEFKPFDGVRDLRNGTIPETSEPYIRYSFHVTSRAVTYGCEIARPLNSDTAFRYFYFEGQELNDTSVEMISIGELGGHMQPPQRITIQDFCFPSSCYGPNEVQHCGTKIGKPYAISVYGIQLFTDKKKRSLLWNTAINKDIEEQDPSHLKNLKALIWRKRIQSEVPNVTFPPISTYEEEFWKSALN